MTKEIVFEKIRDILAETAEIEKEEIQPDSKMIYDIGLSSVELLSLLSTIEEEFSFRIPEKALRTFVTVQDVADYVASEAKEA